ncbi:MAG: type II toxin-antitoxin system RelE/ParE family toxin [Flavobacteriaceae bacterium]
MVGKIIWTENAKNELVEILQYWIHRNKSNLFSIKLNTLIKEQLNLILDFPEIGKASDIPNVRIKMVHDYLLYYEFINGSLYILTIRHGSRNPKTLKLK